MEKLIMETIKIENQDGIAILKISRVAAMNALTIQVLSELGNALEELAADNTVKALVITGDGDKAFVAGADIKEMQNHTGEDALAMSQTGHKLFNSLENFSKPTAACVNGFALGGGLELALSCDFIFASEKTKWGLPEVSLGLIPGYGGTQRLSRSIGINNARLVTMSATLYNAKEAKEWGLFSKVFAPEDLLAETIKVMKGITERAPLAVHYAKRAIKDGFYVGADEGYTIEAKLFSESFKTDDHSEGISAFIEKRKPNFTGR